MSRQELKQRAKQALQAGVVFLLVWGLFVGITLSATYYTQQNPPAEECNIYGNTMPIEFSFQGEYGILSGKAERLRNGRWKLWVNDGRFVIFGNFTVQELKDPATMKWQEIDQKWRTVMPVDGVNFLLPEGLPC